MTCMGKDKMSVEDEDNQRNHFETSIRYVMIPAIRNESFKIKSTVEFYLLQISMKYAFGIPIYSRCTCSVI